jgi:hypothetical protein
VNTKLVLFTCSNSRCITLVPVKENVSWPQLCRLSGVVDDRWVHSLLLIEMPFSALGNPDINVIKQKIADAQFNVL